MLKKNKSIMQLVLNDKCQSRLSLWTPMHDDSPRCTFNLHLDVRPTKRLYIIKLMAIILNTNNKGILPKM